MLIVKKSVSLDLSFFESPAFYDQLKNAEAEAGYRPITVLNETFSLIRNIISLIPFVVLLFALNWIIVLIVAMTIVPYFLVQSGNSYAGYLVMRNRAPEGREMSYVKSLLTSDYSAKEIRLHNLSDYLLRKYVTLFGKIHSENKKLSTRKNLSGFLLEGVSYTSIYGCYAYLVYKTVMQQLTLGDLTLYFQALTQTQSLASQTLLSIAMIWEQTLFISNLFEFLKLEPKIISADKTTRIERINGCIEFRDVWFSYPESERFVLENINFCIHPGETIALVGENGSGKTTLIKLLSRLYDPNKGEILIDGNNIKHIDLADLRKSIGIIFQDFVRYNMSARENIGFGRIEEINDTERIVRAAKQSYVHHVIMNFPNKYETMLGKWFHGGYQLSEGQWQKVALARAVMNQDSRILVLDEPTASLDPRTEYETFKQFKELTKGRTTVLISHRFSTVCMADRIFVLKRGKLIEQGSHKELIASEGEYAQLFKMQAERYQQ